MISEISAINQNVCSWQVFPGQSNVSRQGVEPSLVWTNVKVLQSGRPQTRLERPTRDQLSSLLQTFVNYRRKKTKPYSGTLKRCFTRQGLILPTNIRQGRKSMDNNSSLFQTFINYNCKMFYNMEPQGRLHPFLQILEKYYLKPQVC